MLLRLPWTLLALLALTIFSAFLRFYWIDRPSLWNDEAHTFRRITGSFQDLLDILQADGFAPLNYEWYWWLAHALGSSDPRAGQLPAGAVFDQTYAAANLTPFWMRLLPALCGTAMTPAMYFLSRQLFSKSTSLAVAAFAASSAYLMVFSHDAKMYMPLWLFIALNMGCFLWWLRGGDSTRRIAWLAWIATGLAVGGLHAPGLMIVALQPLLFFAHPQFHWRKLLPEQFQWRRILLFVLGLVIILSGPAGHFMGFNRWRDRVDEDGWDRASGLGWVPAVIDGRSDPDLVRFATSAFLFSWEFPSDDYRFDRARRYVSNPFSGMLQGYAIAIKTDSVLTAATTLILALAAIGLLPWRRWRVLMISSQQPVRGFEVITTGTVAPTRVETASSQPPVQALEIRHPWSLSTLYLLLWLILPPYFFYIATVEKPTTPLDWLEYARDLVGNWWVLILIWLVILSIASHFFRPVRWVLATAAALLVTIPLFLALVRASADYGIAPYYRLPHLFAWYLDWRFFAAALLVLLPLAFHASAPTLKLRAWNVVQLLLVLGAVLFAAHIAHAYHNDPTEEKPMWIPRYIAIVWPAFALIVVALLMRLPTLPLRLLAISLLLGVNLAQTFARFSFGEPPVDHMLADVYGLPGDTSWSFSKRIENWDQLRQLHRKPAPHTRAYIAQGGQTAHPGGGTVSNRPGKYYVSILSGQAFHSRRFLQAEVSEKVSIRAPSNQIIAYDARRNPELTRIIVWDRLNQPPAAGAAQPADTLLVSLGPAWQRSSEAFIPVRYHWNWSDLYTARRREYIRTVGSTQPVSP